MIGLCDLKQTRVTADWFYCRFRNHFNSTISYNYIHSLVGFANTQTDIIWLIGKSWLSVSQQQTSCIASFLPCSSLREGLPGFNRTVDLYIANLTYTCKTAFYKTDCRDKDTACNSIKIPLAGHEYIRSYFRLPRFFFFTYVSLAQQQGKVVLTFFGWEIVFLAYLHGCGSFVSRSCTASSSTIRKFGSSSSSSSPANPASAWLSSLAASARPSPPSSSSPGLG